MLMSGCLPLQMLDIKLGLNLVILSTLFTLVIGLAPFVTFRVTLVSKHLDLCLPCVSHVQSVMLHSGTDSN